MARHPFRFGVINERPLEPSAWVEHVRRVEALGYATFLIRDHLVPDYFGDQYAPLSALTAAACASSRLRVGTMVLANDFRHPAMLAKEAATIAALSDGRLELGLGAGWLRREYEQAGLPYDSASTRIERLDEALRIMRALWAGEELRFAGRHYQIDRLRLFPLPPQRPRLFLGGGKQRMLQLAGRMADTVGLLTTSVASGAMADGPEERTAEAVAQKLEWVRAGAGPHYDELELSLIPSVVLTADRRGATERLIAERGWHGLDVERVWGMPSVFIGDVHEVAADMAARRERYGFSYYVFSDHKAEELAPLVGLLAGQ
jgi:probable F420-dependent oxidoreductase